MLCSELRSEDVADGLHRTGYVVRRNLGAASAKILAESMGKILLRTEVRVRPEGRTYLSHPDPVQLHTDHPDVRYILWYCNTPQASCGENLLLDSKRILLKLGPETINRLERMHLPCPDLCSIEPRPGQEVPIWQPDLQRFFFAPWLAGKCLHDSGAGTLLQLLANTHVFDATIRLEEGDALLIDNHRMLHGRAALERNSRRWLTRYWIA